MPDRLRLLACCTFALSLLGCLAKGDADTAPKTDAAGGGTTTSGATSATSGVSAESASGSAPAPIDSATAAVMQSPSAGVPGDTATKTVGTLVPGRSKQDQATFNAAIRAGERTLASWPKGPAANAGALLPQNRIIAYYGNPHSKKMGVIGEYPEQQMLQMLDRTVAQWKAADPSMPIIPAIHLVTVVAQGAAGSDGMWRRMEDSSMIER